MVSWPMLPWPSMTHRTPPGSPTVIFCGRGFSAAAGGTLACAAAFGVLLLRLASPDFTTQALACRPEQACDHQCSSCKPYMAAAGNARSKMTPMEGRCSGTQLHLLLLGGAISSAVPIKLLCTRTSVRSHMVVIMILH